jgi:hypothetical protein
VQKAGCLAEHGIESVVQAAELAGMAVVDARRAVGEDLDTEPKEQRDRHAEAQRPVHEVAPSGLDDHVQEEVATEVDGGPPRLRRRQEGERDGAVKDLRRVHDEEHAEPAHLGRGRAAHVPADGWS